MNMTVAILAFAGLLLISWGPELIRNRRAYGRMLENNSLSGSAGLLSFNFQHQKNTFNVSREIQGIWDSSESGAEIALLTSQIPIEDYAREALAERCLSAVHAFDPTADLFLRKNRVVVTCKWGVLRENLRPVASCIAECMHNGS